MQKVPNKADKVLNYHKLTKHHPERYARSLGYMDWENQPNPFRFFAGDERLKLPLIKDINGSPYSILFESPRIAPLPIELESVAAVLELALGLSAWKQYGASEWSLRINPSSGNLHPTECYLILPERKGLPASIAHYNPFLHSLEIRARLDDDCAQSLNGLNGFGLILSSIYWRESWKYGERAFRYTQHDIGHALGALRFSTALSGWRVSVQPEVSNEMLNRLLGFEPERQIKGEPERADCFCWASGTDPDQTKIMDWLSALPTPDYKDTPNQLSSSHANWPVIDEVAMLTESPGYAAHRPVTTRPQTHMTSDNLAESIIRQRRSAQSFDPDSSHMKYESFIRILSATLPNGGPPFDALPVPSHLSLILFVHRVDELTPGLYCLVRNTSDLSELRDSFDETFSWKQVDPELPLYLLRQADLSGTAKTISCHQDIAGDGAFSLGMLGRFERLLSDSPWLYPCLFWEAGLIGQTLYLEAEDKGYRGTGIGCYFDDLMHELLGLEGCQWQDLYHFTIGLPLEDGRLQTKPAYHHLAGLRES